MTRAVIIDAVGRVLEVEVDLLELPPMETLSLTTLRDAFTDDDGSVVMLVRKDANYLDWVNRKASALVAPAIERHRTYVRSFALIVGEAITENGYELVDLPQRVGVLDIEELVEYFEKR